MCPLQTGKRSDMSPHAIAHGIRGGTEDLARGDEWGSLGDMKCNKGWPNEVAREHKYV